MLTPSEVDEKLKKIAEGYGLFQCQACAGEMRRWLRGHAIGGIYIQIVAQGSDFIVSKRVGYDTSITQNGYHYGIEVHGRVYDNLPDSGLSRQNWLNDFECIGGFDVEETRF